MGRAHEESAVAEVMRGPRPIHFASGCPSSKERWSSHDAKKRTHTCSRGFARRASRPVRSVSVCAAFVWSDRQGNCSRRRSAMSIAIGGQSRASLAWDGAEPRGSMRPGLRTQHGLGRGLQGRSRESG